LRLLLEELPGLKVRGRDHALEGVVLPDDLVDQIADESHLKGHEDQERTEDDVLGHGAIVGCSRRSVNV
jgi:hypothetical protein